MPMSAATRQTITVRSDRPILQNAARGDKVQPSTAASVG